MKTAKQILSGITFMFLSLAFASCVKTEDVINPTPTDLTVNHVGAYTGIYTSPTGLISLSQKVIITKVSNIQIKIENNGGPIAVPTTVFTLAIKAGTQNEIAGVATDGSSIALSSQGTAISFASGATFTGSK
jgi:hypothetical protein